MNEMKKNQTSNQNKSQSTGSPTEHHDRAFISEQKDFKMNSRQDPNAGLGDQKKKNQLTQQL